MPDDPQDRPEAITEEIREVTDRLRHTLEQIRDLEYEPQSKTPEPQR